MTQLKRSYYLLPTTTYVYRVMAVCSSLQDTVFPHLVVLVPPSSVGTIY